MYLYSGFRSPISVFSYSESPTLVTVLARLLFSRWMEMKYKVEDIPLRARKPRQVAYPTVKKGASLSRKR